MMTTAHDRLCSATFQSLAHTLENLLFMECEQVFSRDAVADLNRKDESILWFRVAINAPCHGWLIIRAQPSLFRQFTEQLFGDEVSSALGDQGVCDAGGELANTVAGYLLAHLIPGEQSFSLGLPEHGTDSLPSVVAKTKGADQETAVVWGLVEGLPIAIEVAGDGLFDHAEYLPDVLPAQQTGVEAQRLPASTDNWGITPEPDPETGRWPAGDTGAWGR